MQTDSGRPPVAAQQKLAVTGSQNMFLGDSFEIRPPRQRQRHAQLELSAASFADQRSTTTDYTKTVTAREGETYAAKITRMGDEN
jgi:hypothetical protein